jgi:T-complex protein 1 subunit delta
MAQVAKAAPSGNHGKFQDKEKPMEVRMSNITAAKGKNCQKVP